MDALKSVAMAAGAAIRGRELLDKKIPPAHVIRLAVLIEHQHKPMPQISRLLCRSVKKDVPGFDWRRHLRVLIRKGFLVWSIAQEKAEISSLGEEVLAAVDWDKMEKKYKEDKGI